MSDECRDISQETARERLAKVKCDSNHGVWSTAIYIAKAIIGAGILSLPVALDACGWILGLFLFFMFGAISTLTCHYLAVIINNFREFMIPRSPYTEYENNASEDGFRVLPTDKVQVAAQELAVVDKETTRELIERDLAKKRWQVDPYNMADIFFGKKWAWLLDLAIFMQTWTSLIPYYQIAGDTMSKVLDYNTSVSSDQQNLWRTLFIIIVAVFWLPFCVVRNIVGITKYTSLFGILGLLYAAILGITYVNLNWTEFTVLEDVEQPDGTEIQEEVVFQVDTNLGVVSVVDLLVRITTFAFAYGCQFCLFYAYTEQGKNASVKNATKSAVIANGLAGTFYLLSMCFMYATFGSEINGSFLDQLHDVYRNDAAIVTGQILLFLGVSTGVPIYAHAGRNAFMSLTGMRPACYEPSTNSVAGWFGIRMKAWIWRGVVSLILCAVAAVIAVLVDDLGFVLSFLGLIGSCPVVLIVPAYWYLRAYSPRWQAITEARMWEKYGNPNQEKPSHRLLWDEPAWKVYLAWFVFILGVVILPVGLTATGLFLGGVDTVQNEGGGI